MADENDQQNTGATGNENNGTAGNGNGTGAPVVLDDATIERIAAASSRQAAQQVNQNGAQGNQQNSGASSNENNSGGNGAADLATKIDALPELITRSIKEAFTPPSTNSGANSNENKGAQGNENQGGQSNEGQGGGEAQQPGRKKGWRGGQWWFE